ncbi:MAG: ACP S-malonyltransferase [Spirochaetales bacterium]|nr:ACP S-malonyltransferase [Spirochaetales bacterium]
MKRCFLFPGQGAQYPGMAKDLYETHIAVRELFELASDAVEQDLTHLLFEASEEELKQTENTQVAITLASLSARRSLLEAGISSDGTAGFSLGEYSALADAGVLDEGDVMVLVRHRGRVMAEAAMNLAGHGNPPGMAAIIGLSYEDILSALEGLDAYPANVNAPNQIVLSGTDAALSAAEGRLKELGARRVIRLKVSAPFHCPLMEEAKEAFKDLIGGFSFRDPEKPLFSNVTGGRISSGTEARDLCLEQIVKPVLWVNEEQAVLQAGFEQCLEVGPGKVLTGLWKSVSSDIPCLPAGTRDDISSILGS